MEEQWELHESPMDSKKSTEAIATNMTLKLATCESLLQSSNVLDSYSNFLTDKEDYIKKINGTFRALNFSLSTNYKYICYVLLQILIRYGRSLRMS